MLKTNKLFVFVFQKLKFKPFLVKFLKYFISGFTAFLVDFLILFLLIRIFDLTDNRIIALFNLQIKESIESFGILIYLPNVISTFFGIVVSFLLNKYWAFGKRKTKVLGESIRYGIVLIFNYFLNNLLFGLIKQYFSLNPLIIKFIVSGIQMFWTFFLYKIFVFKDVPKK